MRIQNTRNDSVEPEVLSVEEKRVAELLGSLPRVEAPGDFDFHLRARIANGAPAVDAGFRWFSVLKVAAPAAFILIFASMFMFSGVFSSGTAEMVNSGSETVEPHQQRREEVAAAPEPKPAIRDELADSGPEVSTVRTDPSRSASRDTAAARQPRTVPVSGTIRPERGGGSMDITTKSTNTMLLEQGKTPDPRVVPDTDPEATGDTDEVRKVLTAVGIDAAKVKDGWRVKSSTGRSGVKAGDVIETIDGKPVTAKTITSGKTMNVIRDGKRVTVVMVNQ